MIKDPVYARATLALFVAITALATAIDPLGLKCAPASDARGLRLGPAGESRPCQIVGPLEISTIAPCMNASRDPARDTLYRIVTNDGRPLNLQLWVHEPIPRATCAQPPR